ncbi:hypothetical protein [Photobacterium profundum]|uniref:hypothetical protein n=1 Tax=Photobacterium profundum TaxID=74109 RepID=UPI00032219C7|nr:hypothetical protein [Photobacterium profundum]
MIGGHPVRSYSHPRDFAIAVLAGQKYNMHTIIDNCQYACVMMQKADDIQRKTGIPASEIITVGKV